MLSQRRGGGVWVTHPPLLEFEIALVVLVKYGNMVCNCPKSNSGKHKWVLILPPPV